MDFAYNRLQALPVDMYALVELKVLGLEGNPLLWPPPEVVLCGIDDILLYLRSVRLVLNKSTKIACAELVRIVVVPPCLVDAKAQWTESQSFLLEVGLWFEHNSSANLAHAGQPLPDPLTTRSVEKPAAALRTLGPRRLNRLLAAVPGLSNP
jgi:hypothetical protein